MGMRSDFEYKLLSEGVGWEISLLRLWSDAIYSI